MSYHGRIPFEQALALEELAWAAVKSGACHHQVIGFESEPVVTFGRRGDPARDLIWPKSRWEELGYRFFDVPRGGQATLHGPGQLVIFPIFDVREIGARRFVDLLAKVTSEFLKRQGLNTEWRCQDPGLYSPTGKVVSMGLRIRQGVSTHGLSLNVNNDLGHFEGIRVCGEAGRKVDRLTTRKSLRELFSEWHEAWSAELTSVPISRNLDPSTCARSSVG